MSATFEPFVAVNVFSELHGFVLCDPVGLDELHDGSAKGLDLLGLYASTEIGDQVARAGLAIPVMGVAAGDYTLVVRPETSPTLLAGPPRLRSAGWVLHVRAEELCLCGAGYLTRWDPTHPRVLRPRVPPGWYEVAIHGGLGAGEPPPWMIELLLRPVAEPPSFRADLGTTFDFARPDPRRGPLRLGAVDGGAAPSLPSEPGRGNEVDR
jgi:hypothetical protein